MFIIEPINLKIVQLQNEKQSIITTNDIEKVIVDNTSDIEEDIILKIEKELSLLLNIDHIDKKMVYDENNNDITNLEIKVNGNIEQIFKINQVISNLELDKNICYFQINKMKNSSDISEESEEILECVIEINVG